MITIREDNSKLLGGGISLFLSFDYNEEIINLIKVCDPHAYNKDDKTWEVTLNSLSYLLDNLCYYDEIDLVLREEILNNDVLLKPTLNYSTKPFEYQFQGIEYGLEHPRFLLLDEPGLGKTLQIIYLAEELKVQKNIKHCLIICGIATLRANWEKEIKKHTSINSSSLIVGKKVSKRGNVSWMTIPQRAEQLMNPIDEFFVVVNIESFRYKDFVEALLNSPNKFDMIAFDEVHKSVDPESLQSKGVLKLEAPYMVGMTGTLLMNSPIDAYTPLAWIGKERKRNFGRFKGTFCEYGINNEIISYKNMNILKDEIDSCSIRRTKEMLKDLPPKNVIIETLEMDGTHSKFYDDVKQGVKEECDKIELKANNILALTTRLRQATSCPSVLTSNNIPPTKILRCIELVDEIVSNGDKVVIFSNFKEPIYQLEKLLSKYKPLVGTGDTKDEIVSKNVDLFQEDDEHMIFLATSQKCGTGITLNRAKYMICIDCAWTSALQTQVEDRIHRVNNTSPCFIYRLICENTIDELVEKLIELKGAISDYMIDDKQDEKTLNILRDYIQDL